MQRFSTTLDKMGIFEEYFLRKPDNFLETLFPKKL